MTGDDTEVEGTPSATGGQDGQPDAETETHPLTAEATRYARLAAENPSSIQENQERIIELLRSAESSTWCQERLERRAAASTALARLARDDADAIRHRLDTLVDELRTERTRDLSEESTQVQHSSQMVSDNLGRTIAHVIVEYPKAVAEIKDVTAYFDSISTDLETETLRRTAKGLFASADELQHPAIAIELLKDLITYSDKVVQASGAGALGRLAKENPGLVAGVATELRGLLDEESETVQHNAVEALGTLVAERPDAVAPAAADLRNLLDHDEVAIQHNAAGVLGRLAETHPDAVVPAVDELGNLRSHEDKAVQRIATVALAQLAKEFPEVSDSE